MTIFDVFAFTIYLLMIVRILSFLSEALSPFILLSGRGLYDIGKSLIAFIPVINVVALTILIGAILS